MEASPKRRTAAWMRGAEPGRRQDADAARRTETPEAAAWKRAVARNEREARGAAARRQWRGGAKDAQQEERADRRTVTADGPGWPGAEPAGPAERPRAAKDAATTQPG